MHSTESISALRRTYDDLVRFETALWNAVDARLLAAGELSLARFEVLQVVARTPACRVQDIAAALAITVGGTSKLVDRLQAAGLCRRAPNPADGRSSLITLTPAGRRRLTRADAIFTEALEEHLGAAVPAADLAHLGRTLATLRAALSPTPEGTP